MDQQGHLSSFARVFFTSMRPDLVTAAASLLFSNRAMIFVEIVKNASFTLELSLALVSRNSMSRFSAYCLPSSWVTWRELSRSLLLPISNFCTPEVKRSTSESQLFTFLKDLLSEISYTRITPCA